MKANTATQAKPVTSKPAAKPAAKSSKSLTPAQIAGRKAWETMRSKAYVAAAAKGRPAIEKLLAAR